MSCSRSACCTMKIEKQALEEENHLNEVQDNINSLAIVQPAPTAPIVSSFNDRIRPLLDAVDKLRSLMVMEEGIQLPTIVVVGDQSSGKSSVLESLAGISLPRGQGICTRVPLVMRLQHHSSSDPELVLEFNGKRVPTDETTISDAITLATDEIAGLGKGISNKPLTLVVKKNGVPDLTMVDLPGITRVAVHGQPENIYDQIRDIIMEYIGPEESIILNVLSATVDFSTCESIRMSQSVDKTGQRTLAVVTKCDKSPEGLLEKVTSDDVRIGLGYVCVRNRIGDESYEEARSEEARLFATHPLLSKIPKSMVCVPVLAQKLVEIQASSIARNLPEIVKKINHKLELNLSELNRLPKKMSNVAEAMTTFVRIVGLVKESMRKILLRGEFDEYLDDKRMHCTARLVEMLDRYSEELNNSPESDPKLDFMMAEIGNLEEAKEISLPNFLPRSAFLSVLQGKVKGVSNIPVAFVEKLWDYIGEVLNRVLMHHIGDYYHHLSLSSRRAGNNLIEKMKESSVTWTTQIVEMEKRTNYTCDPVYSAEYNELISRKDSFIATVFGYREPDIVELNGLGEIDVSNVRKYNKSLVSQAYDLKMMMVSYWKIVVRRLVDGMACHLQASVHRLVNECIEREIVGELITPNGSSIEWMMEESPSVADKRFRLTATVNKLRECNSVLANILDS